MQQGRILVAEHQGNFLIKLVGDVRLTLCHTIDEYFDNMFSRPGFMGVVIDLTETEGIDSTSLGLLAKLAVQAKQRYQLIPSILSTNPNITRLLESMGFRSVFDIRTEPVLSREQLGELPLVAGSEETVRCKVIEAHRVLMGLNEKNQATFKELVSTLENH
jgi:anti-anti-sigma factor